jgi:mono/diheme cytochrome c family protein
MSDTNKNYGILAEYETVDEILSAAAKVRDAGYSKWDCYTPMPVHGLDDAMGVKPTHLPWLTLCAGITGASLGVLMQWWMNAVDYPFLTSGKPQWSLPANIPIVFEMTILFSALTTFFAMWIMNNLPRWFSPLSHLERFARSTDDRFFIAIEASDPSFDAAGSEALLRDSGAHAVEMVAEPEGSATPPIWFRHSLLIGATALLIPLTVIAYARFNTTEQPRIHLVPDMDFQEKYKAQNASPLFEDGRAARPQLAGTFALEDDHLVLEDPGYYTGKENGEYLTALPMPVTRELLDRGRQRYVINCAPCHGYDGAGQGTVNQRAQSLQTAGWIPPSNLHQEYIAIQPKGQLFESISVGIRNMPGYSQTVTTEDRWAIVAYLEALGGTQESGARKLWGAAPVVEEGAIDESPLVAKGRELYMTKTCVACHSLDGAQGVSTSFLGLAGSERKFTDGTTAIADAAYLNESILDPNAKIIEGLTPGLMIVPPISDEEREALVAFILSLKQQ